MLSELSMFWRIVFSPLVQNVLLGVETSFRCRNLNRILLSMFCYRTSRFSLNLKFIVCYFHAFVLQLLMRKGNFSVKVQ